MLNCQQATMLIERTAGRPQQVGAFMALRVHMRRCVLCSRYQEQTLLIARVAAYPSGRGSVQLREAFKNDLQQKIRSGLAALGR